MLSRVYETVERLSVCPINRQQQPAGLLLSVLWTGDIDQQRPALHTSCRRALQQWHLAANVGSVVLTAEDRG